MDSINIIHNYDFSETCRICLKKGKNFVSIFHTKRKSKTMADMLGICLQKNVHQYDGKPTEICLACLPKLISAFEFFNTANKSDLHFEQIICSTSSKQNIPCAEDLIMTEFDRDTKDPLATVYVKFEISEESPTVFKTEKDEGNDACDELKVTPIEEPINQVMPQRNLIPISDISSAENKPRKYARRTRKNFECYVCKRKIQSLNRLQTHMKTHDKVKPYKCNVCGQKFRLRPDLYEHLCQGEKINCEYCPMEFTSTKQATNHLTLHKDQLLFYNCPQCTEVFNMKLLYSLHSNQHEQFQFCCTDCGKKFATEKFLKNHMKRHTDLRRKIDRFI